MEIATKESIFVAPDDINAYRFESGTILKLCPSCSYTFQTTLGFFPKAGGQPHRIVCPGCLGDVFVSVDAVNSGIVRYEHQAAPYRGGAIGPALAVDYSTLYMITSIGFVERSLGANALSHVFDSVQGKAVPLRKVSDFYKTMLTQAGIEITHTYHLFNDGPLPGEALAWIDLVTTVEKLHAN
ncbi:MAG: hypothetical protein HQK81_15660 [Desulfovibrionaceae bacterium]|nr:hypothetical protein [Desulfovibrionaceae bacterium]